MTFCSDWKSSVVDGWKAGTSDDKRWWRGRVEMPRGLIVSGAVWCRHLWTRISSLNLIYSSTFSQCSCVRSGIMWSYFDAEYTTRSSIPITKCICFMMWPAYVNSALKVCFAAHPVLYYASSFLFFTRSFTSFCFFFCFLSLLCCAVSVVIKTE